MKQILEKQSTSLEKVEKLLAMDRLIQLSQAALQLKTDQDMRKDDKLNLDKLDSIAKTLKEMNSTLSKSEKHLAKQVTDVILDKASKLKRVESVSDVLQGRKQNFKDFFTLSGFADKTGIAKRGSGGLIRTFLDEREAANEYAENKLLVNKNTFVPGSKAEKQQRANARREFKTTQKLLKAQDENEAKIQRLRDSGFTDKQIESSGLLGRRDAIAESLKKTDSRFKATAEEAEKSVEKDGISLSKAPVDKSTPMSSENEIEVQRLRERQVELLEKIEENTAALKPATAKEKEGNAEGGGGGGGFLSGLLSGVGKLGGALAKLGRGIGRGLQGMLIGLGAGFAALANPATIIGMGAFSIAAIGIGKALELAAPAIAAFAPIVASVADVIKTVFVEGIKALPEIIGKIGDVVMGIVSTISDGIRGVIDTVVTSVERLAKVDGAGLLQVAAGLVAIGGGLAAFAAGNVVAGLTNIVSGLFSKVTGQKSPLEQLEAIAKLGPGLQQAGDGLQKVSAGLGSFNKPTVSTGNAVAGMTNQVNAAKEAASQGKQQVIVSAPTTVTSTSKQNIAMPQPVRNTDSGFASYLRDKMSFL